MLADRADEVCGKILMRIDVAADDADPADLLLAFFLLLLGLRLDVLKIVAVAYRGALLRISPSVISATKSVWLPRSTLFTTLAER